MKVISVCTLNRQLKTLIENSFEQVLVQGEVSNLTYHASGHIYFSLKDDESSISAVMFRGNASKLKFKLSVGQSLIVQASISLYMPSGRYQLNCFDIHPTGEGALHLAFNQLKATLAKEGLFDPKHKKPLPNYPKAIALITASPSAALADMQKIAAMRFQAVKFYIIPTLVQGQHAKDNIAANIHFANQMNVDIIVLARGGGSLEDLWAFNEEIVARAIFASTKPVVSAIGHESDVLISDLVADQRASTPTAAINLILPDQYELLQTLAEQRQAISQAMQMVLKSKSDHFLHKKTMLLHNNSKQRLENWLHQLNLTKVQLKNELALILARKMQVLKQKSIELEQSKPVKLSQDQAQIVKNGKPVALKQLKVNESFDLINCEVKIKALVLAQNQQ